MDNEANAVLIRDFVSSGGGRIISDQAWSWHKSDGPPYATGYEGNWVTSHFGILFGTNMGSRDTDNPIDTIPALERNLFYAAKTIEAAGDTESDAYKIALTTIARVGDYVVIPETYGLEHYNQINTLAESLYETSSETIAFCRFSLSLYKVYVDQNPVDETRLRIAPDVATFPYEVPSDAERVDRIVTIDATTGDYHSKFSYSGAGRWVWRPTGLYAAASEVVTVTVPDDVFLAPYFR